MVQTVKPDHEIRVVINYYDDKKGYLAWIEHEDYAGICVQGDSFEDVVKELSISLKVLEQYRKNTKK